MSAHPFAGATLFVSARSPFARRVRIALREAGITCREQQENVLEPSPELLSANPFGRVPTLRLADGLVLTESQVILERLWETSPSPLRPREPLARLRADAASGLALVVCEKSVEWYFEHMRPEGQRDGALLEEIRRGVTGALERLEAALTPGPFLLGAEPSTGDVDAVIALDYLWLRLGREWTARCPRLLALHERLSASRPSVRETAPPPA